MSAILFGAAMSISTSNGCSEPITCRISPTRKESDESYSSIAGFFKQYELAIVAADERDVVRVRSNVRDEDVRIYRLRMTPESARRLLREYLEEANELERTPRFYNTLTSNCRTLVFEMVRVIHPGLPLDVRVILAGYSRTMPMLSAPLTPACRSRDFGSFPGSMTRQRKPTPIPTSQLGSERAFQCLTEVARHSHLDVLCSEPLPLLRTLGHLT
jgi:hypothetical protein